MQDKRTDSELLAATREDPAAFGVFYERHEEVVLLFCLRRTGDSELAADLTAETFAQALAAADGYVPGPAPAVAWLLGIARHVVALSWRRQRIEAGARVRLGLPPLVLDDAALERIDSMDVDPAVLARLDALPEDLRRAVRERVIEERDYADLAAELRCSELVVRKRVSRGLSRLRAQLGGRP